MTIELPALHPHLLRWVADCGKGSLVADLRALGDIQPDLIRAAFVPATCAASLTRLDAPLLRGLSRRTSIAWSSPAAATHLLRIADAANDLAVTVDQIAPALTHELNSIDSTRAAMAAAITRANNAVDWTPNYVAWGTPEAALRTAVASELADLVRSAAGALRTSIAALGGLFGKEPAAELSHLAAAAPWPSRRLTPRIDTVGTAARSRLELDLAGSDAWHRVFAGRIRSALLAAGPQAHLLIYDPDAFDGQGRASIALGDVAAADHVAVLTPGIGNSPADMVGSVPVAAALQHEAERAAPGENTAVVLWFGYDIPLSGAPNDTGAVRDVRDTARAVNSTSAVAGAPWLVADTASIRSMMRSSAGLTLIGHSMGSVVTAVAARSAVDVDAVVLIGSPGVGSSDARATDLIGVAPENVFVLSSDRDPVTSDLLDVGATLLEATPIGDLAGRPDSGTAFGTDPSAAEFGAQRLASGSSPAWDPPDPWRYSLSEHALSRYLSGVGLIGVGAVVAGRTARPARVRGR